MLDLLIINPSAAHGITGGHAIYGDLGATLIACEPPLWARLIAGYVRDRGFSVQILDAEAEGLSPTDAAVRAFNAQARLVCLAVFGHQPSASSQQMHGAGLTARALKSLHPSQPIIMVGGHVAALPERTLREEAIDFACNGEGPATILDLLQGDSFDWRQRSLATVPGLVWRDPRDGRRDGDVIVNKPAPLIPVAELHGQAWDLLPMEKFRAHNWQCFGDLGARQPYAAIYTSLGCPYRCSFCCINAPFASASAGGNRYRMREPAEVVSEMLMLHAEHGVRTFKIVDEMFILNERHYVAIAERLAKTELGAVGNIWAYSRIDTVKEGHLDLLRRAGFRWLALGIESGSAHVRDGSQKALKNDDIRGVVRAIQAADINVIGNYIFGLPDDTHESMGETLALALDLNTEFANFYSAMAYPGSALYRQALETGAVLPATWAGYSQHNEESRPLDTQHVSAKEVLAFRDQAFVTYFSDRVYQAKVFYKFGPATLAHVQDMLKYKLRRKLLTGEIV